MPRERSQIIDALTSKGFREEKGNRDHDFLFFSRDGLTQAVFTKLSRGKQYRTVGDPLLAKIARQLKLSRKELDGLVDCPMSEAEYAAKLVAQGVIRAPKPKV